MDCNSLKRNRTTCCVATCSSGTSLDFSITEDFLLRYHYFPKDLKTKKLWMKLCKRKDRKSIIPYKSDRICSKHFCSEQYRQSKKCLQPYYYLKPSAIPCQNLPYKETCRCKEVVGNLDFRPRKIKSLIKEASTKSRKIKITKLMSKENVKTNAISTTNILPPEPLLEIISSNKTLSNSSLDIKKENLPESSQPLLSNNLANLDSESTTQLSQNSETLSNSSLDIKKENLPESSQPLLSNNLANLDSELSTQSSQNSFQDVDIVKVELPVPNLVSNYGNDQNNYYEIKDVQNFILELQQKNMKLCFENKKLLEVQKILEMRSTYLSDKLSKVSAQYTEIDNILKSVFSDSQIARLKNKDCKKNWKKSDIVSARALYAESKEGYYYLRDEMGIPLPCESTLRVWKRSEPIYNDISDELSSPSFAQ